MLIRQHEYCTGVPQAGHNKRPLWNVQFCFIYLVYSQYLVWPPFASHLLHIELIRLLIVACGMLVHSSSMAVRSCWILAGTGTRCRIRIIYVSYQEHPKHAQWVTCPVSMLAMQELATIKGHSKMFSFITQHSHRCCKFWGSVQLACRLQKPPPPEMLPMNWMLPSVKVRQCPKFGIISHLRR